MRSFLITIDTEGDNLWSGPRELTTRNSAFLPRFQELCERYGLKPTYLVNYEMACDARFVDFGRDLLARAQGEIGMHLHAWNSPPLEALTGDDTRWMPYLVEYPEAVLRAKVEVMTRLLEERFERKMVSHRAGRWAFDETYARTLAELGYRVDCSVTPHVDWARVKGDPDGTGGTDYRRFPAEPYFLDLNDIGRRGDSPLLEVPMTIRTRCPAALQRDPGFSIRRLQLMERIVGKIWPKQWLRPNGCNLDAILALVASAAAEGASYVEFMLHSSELMPGGSPTFPTDESIERLYEHLEILFKRATSHFSGSTLAEFRAGFDESHHPDRTLQ